ncbi:DUF2460 domain-containing protein [Cohaesibacter celericrescens]|uniref:TIGR02217 family protein n=1 Tax=Cohaesibacter celericrescens TaxID=2067669 RepID=A0A2N5XQT1_9HYPH|nr:DUF2460 domain-containing protein [Cohaesibacter celericrescens]PLW76800.1 TIGR02217 family protein [Cohaesibacter celericrescens]
MKEFLEIVFPTKIGFGATGGPKRRTQVVTAGSGREERNQQWANSRRSWNVGTGVRDIEEAEEISAFFEEVRGRLSGFLFYDPLDCKSCAVVGQPSAHDQLIGTGNGTARQFQLIKSYGTVQPYDRTITKPKSDTVLIAVDGVTQDPSAYAVNHASGLVTLDDAPADGVSVKAGFEFYIPVRFDTDELSLSWDGHALISVPIIPIVELAL